MKTPERTTLPDNTHEQPIYEVKWWNKWYKYWLSFIFVISSLPILAPVFFYFINPTIAINLLSCLKHPILAMIYLLLCIRGVATTVLEIGDVYFYERHVEIRLFFPFMKRRVIYYDDMHVFVLGYGDLITMAECTVYLSHHKMSPKFWKSPYAWFKANYYDYICFPRTDCTPEILEFLKTKAQSVNDHT